MVRKILTALCFIIAATFFIVPAASAVAPYADVVAVVDESGSMSTEHAWLGPMMTSLDAALVANTPSLSPNQYGLIGFGDGTSSPTNPDINLIPVGGGQFGTAAQFNVATGSLVTTGGWEDGYAGINAALSYTYRADASKNIILVTDEERDNIDTTLTYASILSDLTQNNFLLNAVVYASFQDGAGNSALGIDADGNAYLADGMGGFTVSTGGVAVSGYSTTIADYVDLALATGGAAWDLNQLRAGGLTADSFTSAFVSIKVEEIITTPEPATMLLLGIGLIGLAGLRRKES